MTAPCAQHYKLLHTKNSTRGPDAIRFLPHLAADFAVLQRVAPEAAGGAAVFRFAQPGRKLCPLLPVPVTKEQPIILIHFPPNGASSRVRKIFT